MMQGGDKVWCSDESQGGSGIRESYLDPTSTTNAQNSRTDAYAEAQCWYHLLWGCWPILHIQAHGISFL